MPYLQNCKLAQPYHVRLSGSGGVTAEIKGDANVVFVLSGSDFSFPPLPILVIGKILHKFLC